VTTAITKLLSANIYPKDHIPTPFVRHANGVPRSLTDAEYTDLMTGKSYLAVYGHVAYQDIFDTLHDRVFCY
jgi:hypothetical protein